MAARSRCWMMDPVPTFISNCHMPPRSSMRGPARRWPSALGALCALGVAGCTLVQPAPRPPPPVAAAPEPAPPAPAPARAPEPAAPLQADAAGSADHVLALALALAQEHSPGDLARAASLLEPITQATSPEPQPWQPLARLLAARIAEERRLEDELERQSSQRRDTQRTIQQLSEKLEALKAIERSMTAHPAATPPAGSAPGPESAPPVPKAP